MANPTPRRQAMQDWLDDYANRYNERQLAEAPPPDRMWLNQPADWQQADVQRNLLPHPFVDEQARLAQVRHAQADVHQNPMFMNHHAAVQAGFPWIALAPVSQAAVEQDPLPQVAVRQDRQGMERWLRMRIPDPVRHPVRHPVRCWTWRWTSPENIVEDKVDDNNNRRI